MIRILDTLINESDSIVDTKNSFSSIKDLVAAASKGPKSKSVNLDKISKDLKNLVNENMDQSDDTLNEGNDNNEEKVISMKEIRQEAREMKQFDGCYDDLPLKEVVNDLVNSYISDGYKIVK